MKKFNEDDEPEFASFFSKIANGKFSEKFLEKRSIFLWGEVMIHQPLIGGYFQEDRKSVV